MQDVLLEVRQISCSQTKGHPIFQDASFDVHEGEIIILRGKSGCGKTTFLKCLAHLNVYGGQILLYGMPPKHYGIPSYRTRVLYVPQRPSLLPGTPRDFLERVSTFRALRRSINLDRPAVVAAGWGIDKELWDRPWADLSGGEAQRIALATALGMNVAEILLLDEPTSALDDQSAGLVETHLISALKSDDSALKAVVWITHSAEQAERVGSRFFTLASGGLVESTCPTPQP